MNNKLLSIEKQYLDLCKEVISNGKVKDLFNSSGEHVVSILGAMLRHNFNEGFPIYSSKKVMWKTAVKEMLWFIQGTNDPKWLIDNNINIWNDWIYKAYKLNHPESSLTKETFFKSVKSNSTNLCFNVPLHYSNITNWKETGHNQSDWVLEQLPLAPHRKSYLVSLWDPATVYHQAEETGNESVVLPACHFAHQLVSNSKNRLSLIVDIRSNDLFLGNPFNVAQYGALLEMYCMCLSNRTGRLWCPDELVVMIHDAHIYSNHFDQIKNQFIQADSIKEKRLATLHIENTGQMSLIDFKTDNFYLSGYFPKKPIKADLFDAGGYLST